MAGLVWETTCKKSSFEVVYVWSLIASARVGFSFCWNWRGASFPKPPTPRRKRGKKTFFSCWGRGRRKSTPVSSGLICFRNDQLQSLFGAKRVDGGSLPGNPLSGLSCARCALPSAREARRLLQTGRCETTHRARDLVPPVWCPHRRREGSEMSDYPSKRARSAWCCRFARAWAILR